MNIFGFIDATARWIALRANAAGMLLTEDSGTHTNPRQYEKNNGIVSAAVAVVGPAATSLWAIALPAVNPAGGRTAGKVTTIYSMIFSNNTGGVATVWLEIAAVVITASYPIADGQVLVLDFPAGFNSGNANIDINASVAGVVGQVVGTEV